MKISDYHAALRGDAWRRWDGRRVRLYPAKVNYPFWTSATVAWARVHIARREGVILGIPGERLVGPVIPILLCGASFARSAPTRPYCHRLCTRCLRIAEQQPLPYEPRSVVGAALDEVAKLWLRLDEVAAALEPLTEGSEPR